MLVFGSGVASLLTFGQVHGRKIIVGVEKIVDGVSNETSFLLERTQLFRVYKEVSELLSVDVFFKLAENVRDWIADQRELGFQPARNRDEDCFEGAKTRMEDCCCYCEGRLFGRSLPSRSYIKRGLRIGIGRAVGIEDQDSIALNENREGGGD